MRDKSLEQRNRSFDLLFGKESKDTDLCQTSVVEFRDQTTFLGFSALVLGESKRVVKVQRHWVWDNIRVAEVRVLSWLPSAHVVCSDGLAVEFQESDEKDDLPLGSFGHGIPLLRGRESAHRDTSTDCGPWETDSVGLDNVSYEGSHGNASVLDLRMAQKVDGSLIAFAPDGGARQLEGIVELKFEER